MWNRNRDLSRFQISDRSPGIDRESRPLVSVSGPGLGLGHFSGLGLGKNSTETETKLGKIALKFSKIDFWVQNSF